MHSAPGDHERTMRHICCVGAGSHRPYLRGGGPCAEATTLETSDVETWPKFAGGKTIR